jgi:hypothetical protein
MSLLTSVAQAMAGRITLKPEDHEIADYLATRAIGTGGGYSGWTYDRLKSVWALGDPDFTKGLTVLLEAIMNNELSDDAAALLRNQRGIALAKPNGEPRPIAIGETFYCLAAGLLARKFKQQIIEAIGKHDVGFGHKGGCEVLGHASGLP